MKRPARKKPAAPAPDPGAPAAPDDGFAAGERVCSELDQIAINAPGKDREASEHMWRRVAEGYFDPLVHDWLRAVAGKILAAAAQPASGRRDAVFRATGLAGRRDANRELRRFVSVVASFEDLTKPDGDARRKVARLFDLAHGAGLLDDEMTLDEFRKVISRERSRKRR